MFDELGLKYRSTWWGPLLVYMTLFTSCYLGFWAFVEPLSLPDQIVFHDYLIERWLLHFLVATLTAVHSNLIVSWHIIRKMESEITQKVQESESANRHSYKLEVLLKSEKEQREELVKHAETKLKSTFEHDLNTLRKEIESTKQHFEARINLRNELTRGLTNPVESIESLERLLKILRTEQLRSQNSDSLHYSRPIIAHRRPIDLPTYPNYQGNQHIEHMEPPPPSKSSGLIGLGLIMLIFGIALLIFIGYTMTPVSFQPLVNGTLLSLVASILGLFGMWVVLSLIKWLLSK